MRVRAQASLFTHNHERPVTSEMQWSGKRLHSRFSWCVITKRAGDCISILTLEGIKINSNVALQNPTHAQRLLGLIVIHKFSV